MVDVGDMMLFGVMKEKAAPDMTGFMPIWLAAMIDTFWD